MYVDVHLLNICVQMFQFSGSLYFLLYGVLCCTTDSAVRYVLLNTLLYEILSCIRYYAGKYMYSDVQCIMLQNIFAWEQYILLDDKFWCMIFSVVWYIVMYNKFCSTIHSDVRICSCIINSAVQYFQMFDIFWFIIFSAPQYIFLYHVVRYSCCATYSSVCYILLYTIYSGIWYILLYHLSAVLCIWCMINSVVRYILLWRSFHCTKCSAHIPIYCGVWTIFCSTIYLFW
jgi:hypothetical protein